MPHDHMAVHAKWNRIVEANRPNDTSPETMLRIMEDSDAYSVRVLNTHRALTLSGMKVVGYLLVTDKDMFVFKKAMWRSPDYRHNQPVMVNLVIPAGTEFIMRGRSFSNGDGDYKCRAPRAHVHSIVRINDCKEIDEATAYHNSKFVYRKGTVKAKGFSRKAIDVTCAGGIHFFLDGYSARWY